MAPRRSLIGLFLSSVVAGLLVAGVGVASAGHLTFLSSSPHQSTVRVQSSGVKATTSGGSKASTKTQSSADREKACNEAAGITPGSGGSSGAGATTAAAGKTTGLDHAIEMVMANCMKNPEAPGLLNALRHLVQNRDRHLAHEQEKAARRAAREAARASREGTTSGGS